MNNALSKKFDAPALIKFAFPTIVMMVVLSTYSTVDGAFVSKLISENALASINIVYPLYSIFFAISLMLATGSNAFIAKNMGEGRYEEARSFFTLIYILGFALAVVLAVVSLVFYKPIMHLLGSTPALDAYTADYLRYLVAFAPMSFMQVFTQTFFVTEGRPSLGLWLIVLGGLANIGLDYLFMGIMGLGIKGAALGTGIGNCIPGLFGIFYFAFHRSGPLHFARPVWHGKKLLYSLFNGSSEFVNNISIAITTVMFNYAMIKYLGETGVAAISAILYLQFIQSSIFFGYSLGVAPVISFKYGEDNKPQLKQVVKISVIFLAACSALIFILSLALATPAVEIFVHRDSGTFAIARHGFLLFNISYLFMGLNVLASGMFTALGNGEISALLSFLRTLVFIVGALLLLPLALGVDGVWLAVPVAEAMALCVSVYCFFRFRKKYGY